ncbi:MAG: methionine synthase, partial [Acidobacteria bacterium]|nr:methionine synthase [Acidobacteriota bacterium]
VIRPDSNFTMIGERTNVAGSRRFARLIKAGDFETALEVARDQVEGGANILDVNMDEGLLDSEAVMTTFLNLVAAEPEIARIPIMIDSSKFSVLEAGLRCIQGKGVVNSISLKEGQETFVRQARLVRRYGAAVVVMAFDEEGQAVTSARKVEILSRAYGILTEQVGFPPEDIIFDPNILTVATGMEEHDRYAIEFIEATRELKRRFPLSKVSGGVSNVSFSFRGNDKVREAIHSAFLYHAIEAGLDMGIVNAGQLEVYDDIPKELLTHVEDVLLARRPDATERLVTYAETISGKKKSRVKDDAWRQTSLEERLSHALVRGIVDHLETDLGEALESYGGALAIIEGPLMDGMNVVGDLFGAGKMFLPQVVKSARVMKKAVLFLDPYMERTERRAQAKILMATVKGDVHDIGKNIVGVVLACNNYDIVDLGVMVPAEKILKAAQEEQVDLIGLSGLITPSLDEMVHVASEMNRLKMTTPLLIGGATTSKKHTAVKIAPAYRETSVHVLDASRAVEVVGRLIGKEKLQFQEEIRDTQRALQEAFENRVTAPLVSLAKARAQALATDWSSLRPPEPAFTGSRTLHSVPLDEIVPYIDWTPFFHVWELRGSYPRILNDPKYGTAASELFDNARAMLERIVKDGTLTANGVYGFFPAASTGDDIRVFVDDERTDELARFHTLRQQTGRKDRPRLALADYVAPVDAPCKDWIGAFAVTTGIGTDDLAAGYEADQDDYNAIMVKALADRLAEAFAEMLHLRVRREWGYEPAGEPAFDDLFHERYRGIRPAPGYPACPDHTEKLTIWRLLDAEAATGIRLTESYAMWPAASVSGLYFSHPESKYFSVGKIDRDQVASYAERKNLTVAEVERWLGPNLGYSP